MPALPKQVDRPEGIEATRFPVADTRITQVMHSVDWAILLVILNVVQDLV